MHESKYFYKGIPISLYCQDNNINIKTIYSQIWKKSHNKKYENCSEQEIINMVIEAYGTETKYMYKGISLKEYCLNNNLNVSTIYNRIIKLKKQNKKLTEEEVINLAINEFENHNFKYFYDGIPLIDYCKNKEISYNALRNYITKEKAKNPEFSYEDLIKQYLAKEHKGIYKYYYLGIPLKQYCDENNLNYKSIIQYINKCKNKDFFKNLTSDEFVEAIMENYQPFEPKYMYKGITLRKYCIQNNLSYYSVISFVKRKLAIDNHKNIDDLIDEGIKTINRYGIIYYYKGMPLKDYIEQNNLSYSSIRQAIIKKQLKSNKPLQEIIDECVTSYQKFSLKYRYNGESLLSYCQKIGLSYNTVIQKYLYENEKYQNLSVDDAIKEIMAYYLKHPPRKTKYYVNNQSLAKFCNKNGYSYLAIYRRIKVLESKGLDSDQIITAAIKKYEKRLQITKINDIFLKLKNSKVINPNEIKDICNFLKISLENVSDLVNMDFTYNQAINMIWYFSDYPNSEGYKIITDQKIKTLFSLIEDLKTSKKIEEFSLYDLIGLYKSELYDTRNEILIRQTKYINKTLFSLCNTYNIKVNKSNYEDFESEIKYYLIMVINRTSLNNLGQIIKYMDLTVKGYFRIYLKKYIQNSNFLYEDRYLPKSSMEPNDSSFSLDMKNILATLSPDDLSFIILKYQENYNDEDLAHYLDLTIDEVKQKEIAILSSLKNNQNIQLLRKTI